MNKRSGWHLLIVLGLVLCACSDGDPSWPQRAMPEGLVGNPEVVAAGRELFLAKCGDCHGTLSEGRSQRADFFQPPAPNFTESHYAGIDPAYMFWRIAEGKTVEPFLSRGSVMPAWGPHMSDAEIWSLVVYLQHRSGS